MKKLFKQSLIVLALTAFVFTGCKKSEDPQPTQNNDPKPATGVLVCKVNGSSWQSGESTRKAVYLEDSVKMTDVYFDEDTLSILGINPKTGDTSAILIHFVVKPGRVGVYNLSGTDNNALYLTGLGIDDLLTAAFAYNITSTVEITKYDAGTRKMSGKFNINMKATNAAYKDVTVTDGTFTDVSF
jgi:hypothetical protein